ncbi:MAG: histidine kinase [Bacteroidetes bacterium]|nr:histidine kinase [Bacteroidota bacterium]
MAIRLISTSLRSKGNYQYKYRLLGLDSNWINIEASQSEIVYSSIPPGNFLFQAKAINENEIEGNLVEISIHVDKFLYNEWWFYLIISICVISIFALSFVIRIRFLKQRAISDNILQESQLTALKEQMNPHFIYNALNSIQEFIIKNDIKIPISISANSATSCAKF